MDMNYTITLDDDKISRVTDLIVRLSRKSEAVGILKYDEDINTPTVRAIYDRAKAERAALLDELFEILHNYDLDLGVPNF